MRLDPLAFLGTELDSLREQKLFRHLRILDDEQKAHTTVDHRSVVNLSSNNYLGLTTHPRLRAAALKAINDFGVGTGSVRTIAGTPLVGSPVRLDATRADSDLPPPALGEQLVRRAEGYS